MGSIPIARSINLVDSVALPLLKPEKGANCPGFWTQVDPKFSNQPSSYELDLVKPKVHPKARGISCPFPSNRLFPLWLPPERYGNGFSEHPTADSQATPRPQREQRDGKLHAHVHAR